MATYFGCFPGARQPASQPGGGGFQSLPATQPRLGAAPIAYKATSQKGMPCTPRDPKYGLFSSFSLILAKFPPEPFPPSRG